MTEAGKRWVDKTGITLEDPDNNWHALSRRAAEFWLRAFCEEIEKRGLSFRRGRAGYIELGIALIEIKHELLGD